MSDVPQDKAQTSFTDPELKVMKQSNKGWDYSGNAQVVVDDACQIGPLLDQVAGPVASFTGDSAYDQDSVYRAVIDRDPNAAVIVPPRSTAVPSETAETEPTQRDRHLQRIAVKGRMGWQKASGYNKRSRVEAAIGRYKQVIGGGVSTKSREPCGLAHHRV